MRRVTFMLLLGLVSVGCREQEPPPESSPQTNLPPERRVRDGDAESTTRPAEPISSSLLGNHAKLSNTTLPAGDIIDKLKRQISAASGNTGKASVQVKLFTDIPVSKSMRESSTQPAESRSSLIRRLVEPMGVTITEFSPESTTRPAEPISSSFLRDLAEHAGGATRPAGDMDELMRRLDAACGNTGKVTDKVVILIDDSLSMQVCESSTQPAESRSSFIRRLIEQSDGAITVFSRESTTQPAGKLGESIRRIFDSSDKTDRVIIVSDGYPSELLLKSTTRPGDKVGDTPTP